jgi:hypothetical protein
VTISVRNHTPVSPRTQNPVQLPGYTPAPFPARAGDRRFTGLTAAAYLLLLRRRPHRTRATPATAAHLLHATALAAAYVSRGAA